MLFATPIVQSWALRFTDGFFSYYAILKIPGQMSKGNRELLLFTFK